ncbi:MAG TPA: Holliday junction resolvase RuvX [Clostridia bacterium]|nr:Holliday junction resolvase RuvX [Clostridia bacterium]
MGRILALDVGDARIGLAASDLMQIIANPLETYHRKKNDNDFLYIADLAKQKEVELIVCGLPLGMNNLENEQTQKTRAFIEKLSKFTNLPVRFIDERLTTVSAEKVLIEGNVRRENRKGVIDKVAATIILQNYLDYYKQKS